MRQTTRTLLRGTASAVLVVGAIALFVAVALRGYYAVTFDAFEILSVVDVAAVLACAGLLVAARRVAPDPGDWWVLRTADHVEYAEPEPTRLEELGYRVPPDTENRQRPATTYEDGTVYHLCGECGAKNETEFTYCRECSAKLER